jgi:hypothetical protein
MDFACIDNMKTLSMRDSSHRIYLNFAQIANNLYTLYEDNPSATTGYIGQVIKRHNDSHNKVKLTTFRHILKWPKAVSHLTRLLKTGGVWATDIEPSLLSLFKCRIEEVRSLLLNIYIIYLFYTKVAAFVLKLCADQAEAINEAHPNKRYHLTDLIPEGEPGMKKEGMAFGSGTKYAMSKLRTKMNPELLNCLDKTVWHSPKGVFGLTVRVNSCYHTITHFFCTLVP